MIKKVYFDCGPVSEQYMFVRMYAPLSFIGATC